jgi:chromate reductase, NAD(P)H dehydrogenase (quinone)
MKILTISGSIRTNSSNSALLESFALLAEENAEICSLGFLSNLPHFDPNLDDTSLPYEVIALREAVANSDVVYFSTPEYIHALPAILKNCLEWMVGDPRFYLKNVVILRTSSGSTFANESLREVLSTMSAVLINEASMVIPLPSNKISRDEMMSNPEIRAMLLKSFNVTEQYQKRQNKTVVATAGNVSCSLRSGSPISAVPHL